jgi:hypothetical protein
LTSRDNSGKIRSINKQTKGSKMTLQIGQTFTTQKSGVSGTVQEIVENANGSLRVRLDVNGQDRWTTVKESK